jgi:hypothetical protein
MSMQRLHLEFAPHSRRMSPIGIVMLVLSGAALVGGALEVADIAAANGRLADTLAAVEARRGALVADAKPGKPDPREIARTRAIRQVSQSLMTPWADLLESLESIDGSSVAILSIEPSVAKHSIRITAEARSARDMLTYLGALQQETRLSSVVLVSHQVEVQAPGSPVRFQVHAAWGAGQ